MEAVLRRLALLGARCLIRRGSGQPPAGHCIYCANHTSHLDAVLLMAGVGQAARPVAAAEYWGASRLRRYLTERVFRAVLIARESQDWNPLGGAVAALRNGDSLLFFPEGTRGPGGDLLPFKQGLYCLARAFPQVDIVPVWIDNAARVLPKHAALPVPAACALHFGTPLRWDGTEEAAGFLARLRAAMEALRPQ